MSKPAKASGLWASPVNAEYGWKEWCEAENFRECNPDNSFTFTLKESATVLLINSIEDIKGLPEVTDSENTIKLWAVLDFEKMLNDDIYAIQLNMSSDDNRYDLDSLYMKMYGWDCDSILIMNKDIINIQGK